MNLGEMLAECGRFLNDPNNQRWSTTILTSRLNEAQKQFLSDTRAIKVSQSLTPVASQQYIDINTGPSGTDILDVIAVFKTRTDGKILPLKFLTFEQLNLQYPNWQNWSDGEPKVAYLDHAQDYLYLAPAPDSSNAITNGIKFYIVPLVNDMSSTSDLPFTLQGFYGTNYSLSPYHMALVHFAVSLCWADDATPESLAKSRFHRSNLFNDMNRAGEYERYVMKCIEKFNAQQAAETRLHWFPTGGRLYNVFGIGDRKSFFLNS